MYIRASICFNCCQVSGDMFVRGYTRRPGRSLRSTCIKRCACSNGTKEGLYNIIK